jgi:GNAT superfamily N-acetyltransferase
MTVLRIREIPSDAQPAAMSEIEVELLRSLAQTNAQTANTQIVLTAEDPAGGGMAGGVVASTSYGWLLVKILWVRDDLRGCGAGRRLMDAVEDRGGQAGCHGAWLDTSSAAAREFYERLGYTEFGKLENAPGDSVPEHRRWFLQKRL